MSRTTINEIQRLYDQATAATVERDLKRAVDILKTIPDEEARERAAVFMDGLSQMRSEWRLEQQRRQRKRGVIGTRKKRGTKRPS
jgi:hypothetical protein